MRIQTQKRECSVCENMYMEAGLLPSGTVMMAIKPSVDLVSTHSKVISAISATNVAN